MNCIELFCIVLLMMMMMMKMMRRRMGMRMMSMMMTTMKNMGMVQIAGRVNFCLYNLCAKEGLSGKLSKYIIIVYSAVYIQPDL